jgi:hypothetical protein
MILNTRISFSLCALLAILTPAVIEAVPEKEKKPAKIEGTANPEKFPAKDPDEALRSTITRQKAIALSYFRLPNRRLPAGFRGTSPQDLTARRRGKTALILLPPLPD